MSWRLVRGEVWGCFVSEGYLKKLESCNNRAARIIAETNSLHARRETELPSMKPVVDEEATKQSAEFLEIPKTHHLKRLIENQYNRPRLKLKGKVQPWRMDWTKENKSSWIVRENWNLGRSKTQSIAQRRDVIMRNNWWRWIKNQITTISASGKKTKGH